MKELIIENNTMKKEINENEDKGKEKIHDLDIIKEFKHAIYINFVHQLNYFSPFQNSQVFYFFHLIALNTLFLKLFY